MKHDIESVVLPSRASIITDVNSSDGSLRYLMAELTLSQAWLDKPSPKQLLLVYCADASGLHSLLVSDRSELKTEIVPLLALPGFDLLDFAQREKLPLLPGHALLRLSTVSVPKPWGQEIWYTGVEQRGVCEVETLASNCPLPWLQAAFSPSYSGLDPDRAMVLLKILDPHPVPVIGDLYFELHEQKQEVYVITSVSDEAWPDGAGRIRIGFSPEMRAHYQSENEFKQAYLSAVKSYRGIRVTIDEWLDQHQPAGDAVLDLQATKARLASVPPDMANEEQALRRRMEAFTQLHELNVGDVVTIPRLLPHALQHGVRAVEFQTPVYERKIVSFAQKVLTQAHWDTEEAIELCRADNYVSPEFDYEPKGDGRWQRVVVFDDFEVWRGELQPNGTANLGDFSGYQILMPINGNLCCMHSTVSAEQAVLLLKCLPSVSIQNPGLDLVTYLLARPLSGIKSKSEA